MSDNVHVAFGDDQAATAQALLAAADELDLDPSVVRLDTSTGTFSVPEEVASKAKGLEAHDPYEEQILAVADAVEANGEPHDPYAGAPDAVPDVQAGQDAVGGIDQGPSAEEADAAQLVQNPHTTTAEQKPAKKAAAKRPAKKAAAKKTTPAKKAAAKKATKKAAPKKES